MGISPVPGRLDREDRVIQETLSNLGKDGWDLVAVYEAGFRVFVLKRPLGQLSSG